MREAHDWQRIGDQRMRCTACETTTSIFDGGALAEAVTDRCPAPFDPARPYDRTN